MAKLTVKNVGPIREAEIEVKKHTVFIGPQGTGKSTLAKLIAIGGDDETSLKSNVEKKIIQTFNLNAYVNEKSLFSFHSEKYRVEYKDGHLNMTSDFIIPKDIDSLLNDFSQYVDNLRNNTYELEKFQVEFKELMGENVQLNYENPKESPPTMLQLVKLLLTYKDRIENIIFRSSYIPAERSLLSLLNNAIWSLTNLDINLPKSISNFAKQYYHSRNVILKMTIPFLDIHFRMINDIDHVILDMDKSIPLSQSASGYQSIIPLLLVVEHQRQQSQRRFIIEEPELNLYPTAQKNLIYSLMSGLDPAVEYKDAEWVITTHSPYVLTSFNTLMLAYKVAQKSEKLRAEVKKIVPARCWINPDEFVAYYVDNGTVRNIISEKTGMIADSELDNVSEDFAGEQDQLLDLYRSVPSA